MNDRHSRRALPYQPFLIALFIVESVYATNRLFVPPEAMLLPLAVLTGVVALSLMVVNYAKWDPNKGLIGISGALLLNYTYYPIRDALTETASWHGVGAVAIIFAALAAVLTIAIWRSTRSQAAVYARILGIMAISLVLVGSANLTLSVVAGVLEGEHVGGGFEEEFQRSLNRSLSAPLNDRDFYFLVVDRYPGEETLFAETGFDNRGFYAVLRSMGCAVMEKSRSNYGFTARSIPSMLNMDYYESSRTAGYDEENNRLWRFFKSQGFTFVFLPSNWVSTTRNENADVVVNPYPITLDSASRNLIFQKIMFFERTFLGWTYYKTRQIASGGTMPLQTIEALQERMQNLESASFNRQFGPGRRFVELAQTHIPNTFEALSAIPKIAGKKFVFSHINHWEYVIGSRGSPLASVNESLAALIKSLIAASDPDPVIVIMSDHGGKPDPRTLEEHRALYARYARYPEGAVDKEAILASWYTVNNVEIFCLPDGGDRVVYPGMTPVNAWRMILNYYFGTGFGRLADRAFWKWRYDRGIVELD